MCRISSAKRCQHLTYAMSNGLSDELAFDPTTKTIQGLINRAERVDEMAAA
jgi:hypothetical protein